MGRLAIPKQFGLRSLMVVVLLLSVAAAWVGAEARNERRVREMCVRLNLGIGYDYQWQPSNANRFLGEADYSRRPPPRKWGAQWLGEEYWSDIVAVTLHNPTDEDMAILGKLKTLKDLHISGSSVSDAGLAHLRNCSELENLCLEETHITGAGLSELRNFPKLKFLKVMDTQLTGEGLQAIKQCRSLEWVMLCVKGSSESHSVDVAGDPDALSDLLADLDKQRAYYELTPTPAIPQPTAATTEASAILSKFKSLKRLISKQNDHVAGCGVENLSKNALLRKISGPD